MFSSFGRMVIYIIRKELLRGIFASVSNQINRLMGFSTDKMCSNLARTIDLPLTSLLLVMAFSTHTCPRTLRSSCRQPSRNLLPRGPLSHHTTLSQQQGIRNAVRYCLCSVWWLRRFESGFLSASPNHPRGCKWQCKSCTCSWQMAWGRVRPFKWFGGMRLDKRLDIYQQDDCAAALGVDGRCIAHTVKRLTSFGSSVFTVACLRHYASWWWWWWKCRICFKIIGKSTGKPPHLSEYKAFTILNQQLRQEPKLTINRVCQTQDPI